MKGKKYILLKAKIPVWLKWWWYKKGELISLKNLYLGYSRQTQTAGKNLMSLSSYNSSEERQKIFNIGLSAGTYTVSFDLESFELGTNTFFGLYMALFGETQLIDKNMLIINEDTTTGRKYVNFTINADSLITANSNIRISNTAYNNGARATISNIQIEAGTEATPYEQYTGGIPAPNPEYPFEIENLTGNVPIQAGNKVITFPLPEGQKLYRDSQLTPNGIQNIRKQIILNGSENNWEQATTAVANKSRWIIPVDNAKQTSSSSEIADIYSNYYIKCAFGGGNGTYNNVQGISVANYSSKIGIYDDTHNTDLTDWKNWLSTHNLIIEYELAESETVAYTDAQLQAYTNLCKYFGENTDLNNYIVGG